MLFPILYHPLKRKLYLKLYGEWIGGHLVIFYMYRMIQYFSPCSSSRVCFANGIMIVRNSDICGVWQLIWHLQPCCMVQFMMSGTWLWALHFALTWIHARCWYLFCMIHSISTSWPCQHCLSLNSNSMIVNNADHDYQL